MKKHIFFGGKRSIYLLLFFVRSGKTHADYNILPSAAEYEYEYIFKHTTGKAHDRKSARYFLVEYVLIIIHIAVGYSFGNAEKNPKKFG